LPFAFCLLPGETMQTGNEPWTILKILNWTKEYLAGKGVENARLETEWLLSAALGLDRIGLYINFEKPLLPVELATFREMVSRRAKREPLQYILGNQEFMGLEFRVTPAVLIPRHDTETLVQEAVNRAAGAKRVLDIGAGSGCIAVTLAKLLPDAEITAVDSSDAALAVAQENAEQNGVNVNFVSGSLFEPFVGERFDLIVSNPPYIPTADLAGLQPEVREYEPKGALDGGAGGLDFYRLIVPAAPGHLNPGGWLMVEAGIGQANAVQQLFSDAGFSDVFTARDPSNIERVIGGRFCAER
jgi:release factor glutamine methyltransferase